mgnify:CR=1 FL=1
MNPMPSKLILVFTVVCSLLQYGCSLPSTDLPDMGVSFELNKQRKQDLDRVAYSLQFKIPANKIDPIEGKINISFDLKSIENPLILDFSNPESHLHAVRLNGKEVKYQFENEHIIVGSEYLNLGISNLEILFTAGDLSLNRNEDYLYTLFVPDRASTCFPLFDQPNLKATYELSLTTPTDWEAVANGPLLNKTESNGSVMYQFGKTKPISSYLFAFTAGKFFKQTQKVNNRDITIYYRETDSIAVARNIEEVFRLHGQSLDWLENYTGIQYPFEKFDVALIPSFQYGGMEHPGTVFYNESSLILEENPTLNKKMARASVIAHESAHMWFGDLVTMDWFNDVWLKEVFANFMAAKIVHPSFPEINHDLRFLMAHYPSAYAVDRTAGTNPILQQLDNLKNAGTMYGSIIYQKAPVVMRQLELKIGEKLMQESLQEYLHRFSFGNATWDDLVSIIDSKSILNITEWSNIWVKTSGMPVYEQVNASSGIMLKQVVDSVSNRVWQQPLEYSVYNGKSFSVSQSNIENLQAIKLTSDTSAIVFPNSNGVGYGYFKLNLASYQYFISHYETFSDPVFRGSMLVNVWENFLNGEGPSSEKFLMDLLSLLQKEENPILIDKILGSFKTIWWKFLPGDQRATTQLQAETELWTLLAKTEDKGLKSTYFNAYKDICLSPNALKNLKEVWRGTLKVPGLALSENDKISIVCELAVKDAEDSELMLHQQIDSIQNPDRRAKMIFVLPSLSNKGYTRDNFFESLKNPEYREKEAWVLEALLYLHHPLRQQSAEKYLLPSMDMLQEIQLTGDIFFPTRWMDNTFAGHSSKEALKVAREFLYNNPEYPVFLRNKILQSIDLLERSVKQQARAN